MRTRPPPSKREFVEWVSRAPDRVEACLRVARVHAAVSREDVRWPQTSAGSARTRGAGRSRKSIPRAPASLSPQAAKKSRRRPALQWAAGLAASVMRARPASPGGSNLSHPEQFQTKLGEQRSVLLADGRASR